MLHKTSTLIYLIYNNFKLVDVDMIIVMVYIYINKNAQTFYVHAYEQEIRMYNRK